MLKEAEWHWQKVLAEGGQTRWPDGKREGTETSNPKTEQGHF